MLNKNRNEIIAKNIRKYIKENGITQRELAKSVSISESTMSDYLNLRSNPSHGVIQKIADYFGVGKSDIDTTFKEEFEVSTELLNGIHRTVSQLNEENQKDVLDFAEMKLNKQNESKILELPKKNNSLSKKVEREQREIEEEIADMMAKHSFAAYEEQDIENMSDEDRELLEAAFRHVVTESRRIAKEKFTPKKHRKD